LVHGWYIVGTNIVLCMLYNTEVNTQHTCSDTQTNIKYTNSTLTSEYISVLGVFVVHTKPTALRVGAPQWVCTAIYVCVEGHSSDLHNSNTHTKSHVITSMCFCKIDNTCKICVKQTNKVIRCNCWCMVGT